MRSALERDLGERRAALRDAPVLARSAARLRRLLQPVLDRPVDLPVAKALLSRDGGVCPDDGARLAFDPLAPDRHLCLRCGRTVSGERHHRAWITRYQLWLSERAIHLALLHALLDEPRLAQRAADILVAYTERYRSYPNRDNVLGPSRLFFSTYLESIWLTQIAIAAALLDVAAPEALDPRSRRQVRVMIAEAADLIAEFDEGWSNRQVWNNAALVAAATVLDNEGDVAAVERRLRAQLGGIGTDGFWIEGENYHFFALRGFVLAAEALRWCGRDLYRDTRLGAMFAAPLATALPDLTVPARGDAPFGVSLRQPRFAELWELGRARAPDVRLDAILRELYAAGVADATDDGWRELAEQEENRPPHRQYRDRLGWKALLWMSPDDPHGGGDWHGSSVVLDAHGAAILRPDAARYVGVECGGRGAGHGHPDALHLSLYWSRPLLTDFGTASYVSHSLHWYRSTLAHNAPGIAGAGQTPAAGWCEAHAADGGWEWCRVRVRDPFGPETEAVRSIVLGPSLVVDMLDVRAPPSVTVDLPIHPHGTFAIPAGSSAGFAPRPGCGHETGYDQVTHAATVPDPYDPISILNAAGPPARILLARRDGETVFAATAPGAPGPDFADGPPTPFLVRRATGSGRWIAAYTLEEISALLADGASVTATTPRGVARLVFGTDGVEISDEGTRVILRGARPAPPPRRIADPPVPRPLAVPLLSEERESAGVPDPALHLTLGAEHYRRSELTYEAIQPFSAEVALAAQRDAVIVAVSVTKTDLVTRPPDAPDPALDNETPDIHSDGVQLYVGRDAWEGYLIVPEPDVNGARVRPVRGTAADPARVDATFSPTGDGYRIVARCRTARPFQRGDRFRVNVAVNEMRPGRERRGGQLVLTGGGWVYLRGDREPEHGAAVAEVR